ncbi:hypothetical protein [Pontibacter harenae]|uniref:hypothetical protein n=1 Tax=Pontibacter harenae TaxID=2894083 RepID=UPI001E6382E5|nr:hypothetical protein [Pontibacter harenae]MCC9165254.1 hypothetical protein [Pontibacter harenae]
MTKPIYILTLLLLLVACQGRERKQEESFDSKFVVRSYHSNSDNPENLKSVKYYDSSDRLLREIGREGDCIRYIYDERGKLLEKVWGRGCQQVMGVRNILIYDYLGNHVGAYTTSDTLVNIDTVSFEQIYFYDSENRLVKEKIAERIEPQGDTIKTWNYYTYVGNKKDSLLVKENNGLLWKGVYNYDTTGRLLELRKTRRDTYENEYFLYDDFGKLVEKQTKTNYKIATPLGVAKAPNSRTTSTYDSAGFQTKEILYHNGKAVVQVVHTKEYKN